MLAPLDLLFSSTVFFVCLGPVPQGLHHYSFVGCLYASQTSPMSLFFFLENDSAVLDTPTPPHRLQN